MSTPCKLKRAIIKNGELSVKEFNSVKSMADMEHFLRANSAVYIGENKWATTFINGSIIIDEIVPV